MVALQIVCHVACRHVWNVTYYVVTMLMSLRRSEFGFETAYSVLLQLTIRPAFTQVLFSRYADLV